MTSMDTLPSLVSPKFAPLRDCRLRARVGDRGTVDFFLFETAAILELQFYIAIYIIFEC